MTLESRGITHYDRINIISSISYAIPSPLNMNLNLHDKHQVEKDSHVTETNARKVIVKYPFFLVKTHLTLLQECHII